MNLRWEIISATDITQDNLLRVAQLKDQYWPHGMESQLEWINKNININDFHLLGIEEDIVAYLDIVRVKVYFDANEIMCWGLGNVCVDNSVRNQGIGSLLIKKANEFILENDGNGILLCKETLVSFYRKNGWVLLDYENAYVEETQYNKEIMTLYHELATVKSIAVSRNF